jgi:aminoglycoside phosphotransferase (APT) family kinase protein
VNGHAPPFSTAEFDGVATALRGAGVEVRGELTGALVAAGRSNLTVRLYDEHRCWVLRTPPRAGRTPSAHDVAREHRITRALGSTAVPVPGAVLLCEDESVLGAPFAVADFVEGRTLQSRGDLAELDDETLGRCVARLVETLAALHRVEPDLVGLGDLGRPFGYAERQVRRWRGQWDLVGVPGLTVAATELAEGLASAVPDQRRSRLVHGDFRIDNALLELAPDVRVAAVVDWELSTLGDPVADVALMAVYRHPALDLILGLDAAWASPRLPDAAGLAEAYEAAGGMPLEHWDYHRALACFKLAVIAAGIAHRQSAAHAGGEPDPAAGAVEPMLVEGLRLLQRTSA